MCIASGLFKADFQVECAREFLGLECARGSGGGGTVVTPRLSPSLVAPRRRPLRRSSRLSTLAVPCISAAALSPAFTLSRAEPSRAGPALVHRRAGRCNGAERRGQRGCWLLAAAVADQLEPPGLSWTTAGLVSTQPAGDAAERTSRQQQRHTDTQTGGQPEPPRRSLAERRRRALSAQTFVFISNAPRHPFSHCQRRLLSLDCQLCACARPSDRLSVRAARYLPARPPGPVASWARPHTAGWRIAARPGWAPPTSSRPPRRHGPDSRGKKNA